MWKSWRSSNFRTSAFSLIGGIPVTGNVRVDETLIMDGNIGTRFLVNWDLTRDLEKGVLG